MCIRDSSGYGKFYYLYVFFLIVSAYIIYLSLIHIYVIPAERMSFSFRFCPAKQSGVSGNRQYLNFK